jgi:hypothetical protein
MAKNKGEYNSLTVLDEIREYVSISYRQKVDIEEEVVYLKWFLAGDDWLYEGDELCVSMEDFWDSDFMRSIHKVLIETAKAYYYGEILNSEDYKLKLVYGDD